MSWSALGATIATIVAVCSLLDWMLSKEEIERERLTLIQWWLRLEAFNTTEAIRRAARLFNAVFDRAYGARWLSPRRIVSSTLFTVVFVLILGYFFVEQGQYRYENLDPVLLALNGPALFAFNVVVDFITLSKSRWLLRHAEYAKGGCLIGLVLIDTILTAAIYLVPLSYWILQLLTDAMPSRHVTMYNVLLWTYATTVKEHNTLWPMFFGAAFGTSIMFYIYLLVALSIRFIGMTRTRSLILLDKLSGSNDLFKSIGIVVGALLAAGKGIGDFVVALL